MKVFLMFLMMAFFSFTLKELNVRQSQEKWQADLNILEASKNAIRQSDIPARVALQLVDSLTRIQMDFVKQLNLQADTTKKK